MVFQFDLFEQSSGRQQQWGHFDVGDVRGLAGLGFHRLIFDLNVQMEPAAERASRLVGLTLELSLSGAAQGAVGRLKPTPVALPLDRSPGSTRRTSIALDLDLDRERLEAIERVRNGGDLSFMVMAYSSLEYPDGQVLSIQTAAGTHDIIQGAWVRILEQMDYSRTLLLEVPAFDARDSAELAAAGNYLARAQQSMARGDYREAVGLCRDTMEEVEKALRDREQDATFENLRQKDKAQRVQLIRRALRVFAHPARHRDEVAAHIDWGRLDATCAISMTSALLLELTLPDSRPAPGSQTAGEGPAASGARPDDTDDTLPTEAGGA